MYSVSDESIQIITSRIVKPKFPKKHILIKSGIININCMFIDDNMIVMGY